MTSRERTIVRTAIDDAKRAWLEEAGGFKSVELDARALDAKVAGQGRGRYSRKHQAGAELGRVKASLTRSMKARERLEAELRETRKELKEARRTIAKLKRRFNRVFGTVNSRSTGHLG